MVKVNDLPKQMQEQIRIVEFSEAAKEVQKMMKEPLYQEVMWNEFMLMLEKKKKRMEKKYPYKVYRTFQLLIWFMNE